MYFSVTAHTLGGKKNIKSISRVTTHNKWFTQSGKVVEKLKKHHKKKQTSLFHNLSHI